MSQTRSLIRFGVVCEGESLPRWQANSLRRLLAMEGVVLAGVLLVDAAAPVDPRPGSLAWQRLAARAKVALAALQPCPLSSLPLSCTPARYPMLLDDNQRLRLGPEGRQFLAELNLDVLLSLVPWRLNSDAAPLARRGE